VGLREKNLEVFPRLVSNVLFSSFFNIILEKSRGSNRRDSWVENLPGSESSITGISEGNGLRDL